MKNTLLFILGVVVGVSAFAVYDANRNRNIEEQIEREFVFLHEKKQQAYYISSILHQNAFNLENIKDERFSPYSYLAGAFEATLSKEEIMKFRAKRNSQFNDDYERAHQESINLSFLMQGLITEENFPGGEWTRERWSRLIAKHEALFKEGYGDVKPSGMINLPN